MTASIATRNNCLNLASIEEASVGFVVIGRNEGERLAASLDSVPGAYPRLYCDSGSTDDSVDVARAKGWHVSILDANSPFTAARARKEGFERLIEIQPGLDFVQFLDGDCVLEEGWIDCGSQALRNDVGLAAVCGRRRERFPDRSFYNALFDKEWATPIGLADATGGDALFRVDAYQQVGGFNERLSAGEEPELAHRLRRSGWKIERLDAAMTIHDADVHRFAQWWRRAVRSGYGYMQAYFVTRQSDLPALYQTELLRSFFWAIAVPMLAILTGMFLRPIGFAGAPLAWAAQWFRLSMRSGPRHSALLIAGKFAEAIGALRYLSDRISGKATDAIAYK